MTHLRSEAPLLLRLAPGGRAHLVGGAAGPLGGDDLALAIRVGALARLEVRGVAAMLAQPGPAGGRGRLVVTADVGEDGHLDWDVQPTIVVAGADLDVDLRIALASGATLRWREELVLGRSAEQPGRVRTRVRLTEGGRTTLDHRQVAGGAPGPWDGPGDLGGHRWLGSELRVGRGPAARPPLASHGARAADLVLASGAVLAVATATDRRTGLPALDRPPGRPVVRATSAAIA
ncbi:urease accessory protein UreD [Iamia sp. SCSIO 61187]|uniref:urease accessory protein UreD n=1 Tax=Iamia sp. SCSIO 61187 TaxID=2722752 RepID=UPI001C62EDED|nr:urease accessory protein UreD [Iamia sp. SCSIO 61187]QYG94029.1 urease accessory protein UreD [Iamia sp. SCSIO 61187]